MTATPATRPRSTGVAILAAMRPRQWVKNLLVVAAPLAAGRLAEPAVALPTLVAVVAFCLASSAVYLFNDATDAEADRQHPTKRLRPIAAGEVPVRAAYALAGALALAGLAVASTTGTALPTLLLSYLGLQVAYALRLKHEPVVDIAVVATGFLLRAVAGGLAADLRISAWFLLVAGFGSLFIVAGKRYSELRTLGAGLGTRPALVRYTETYLRFIWSISAAVTIVTYSLWAVGRAGGGGTSWHLVSIAPFVLGLMRYAMDIDAGRAGDPEEIVWRDRVLQVVGAAWLLLVLAGVMDG